MTTIDSIKMGAYCKAFELMGSNPDTGQSWASELCAELDPLWIGVSVIDGSPRVAYQDVAGDGKIIAPEYRLIGKQWSVGSWKELEQDAKGEDPKPKQTKIYNEKVAYFIAGAFGILELPEENPHKPTNPPFWYEDIYFARSAINPMIVSGLQAVYLECLENQETCLATSAAQQLKQAVEKSEVQREIAKLRKDYERLRGAVSARDQLEQSVAQYELSMRKALDTVEGLQEIRFDLEKMIDIAEGQEERERRVVREDEMRAELPQYEEKIKGQRGLIADAEGWNYSRFTEAYDAGMACMPSTLGLSFEKQHQVVENQYKMGGGLLKKAKNFPEHPNCVEWKPVGVDDDPGLATQEQTEWAFGSSDRRVDAFGNSFVCEAWGEPTGYNYTDEELLKFAKSFCSTSPVE